MIKKKILKKLNYFTKFPLSNKSQYIIILYAQIKTDMGQEVPARTDLGSTTVLAKKMALCRAD